MTEQTEGAEHTPTTQEVRTAYVMARYETESVNNPRLYAEFARWLDGIEAAAEVRGAQAERNRRQDYAAVSGYQLGYVEGAQAVLAAVEAVVCDRRHDINRATRALAAARAAAAAAGGGA